MKKKILSRMPLALSLMLFVTGCSSSNNTSSVTETTETVEKTDNSEAENDEEISDSNNATSSAFQIQSAQSSNSNSEIGYEDGNILSFELVEKDVGSGETNKGVFKVTNNGSDPVDYMSFDFSYVDDEGNQLAKDGRYQDCQIEPGKSAYVNTYDSSSNNTNISDIIVTEYDYDIGDTRYTINLQQEKISFYTMKIHNDLPLEEANILEFTYNDLGYVSTGSYKVEVQAKNNGNLDIPYISIRMAYFDENGDLLDKDGRYNDNYLEPGKYVTLNSYGSSDSISGYGIFSYTYELAEDDSNGFNRYEVNLQTGEVTGSHKD